MNWKGETGQLALCSIHLHQRPANLGFFDCRQCSFALFRFVFYSFIDSKNRLKSNYAEAVLNTDDHVVVNKKLEIHVDKITKRASCQ
jgi:hypothetical protein